MCLQIVPIFIILSDWFNCVLLYYNYCMIEHCLCCVVMQLCSFMLLWLGCPVVLIWCIPGYGTWVSFGAKWLWLCIKFLFIYNSGLGNHYIILVLISLECLSACEHTVVMLSYLDFFAFSLHQQAQSVILSHNTSSPLFLYLPFQNVHGPTQAPEEYVDKYQFIEDKTRREYAAMVDIVDEAIGNVTQAMQQAGWVSWLWGGGELPCPCPCPWVI